MGKKSPQTIILLGRSGSGKDTQVRLLEEKTGFRIFATGDALRKVASERTILGRRLHEELQKGNLAPTWLASFLWIKTLVELRPSEGIIFNGSPRKLEEAKLIDEVLVWLGRGRPRVVLVDVSEKEAFTRLTKRKICTRCHAIVPYLEEYRLWKACGKCGGRLKARPDDKPRAIRTRFSWFKKEVGPVIRYYQAQRTLKVINGEQNIQSVFKDILKASRS